MFCTYLVIFYGVCSSAISSLFAGLWPWLLEGFFLCKFISPFQSWKRVFEQRNKNSNFKKDQRHQKNDFPTKNQIFYFVHQKKKSWTNSKLRFDLAQIFFQLCSFSSCFVLPPLLSKLSAPSCGLNKSIKMKSLTLNSNQP